MVFYRRNFIAGGTYFFTATLADRKRDWLVRHVDLLRAGFSSRAGVNDPLRSRRLVVLPDHLHSIWTLPPGDADYSHRWRLIKARFSTGAIGGGRRGSQRTPRVNTTCGSGGFGSIRCVTNGDLQAHVDYIHYNPVKHGLVTRVGDWPYSSFHRFVRMGWLSADWADDPNLSEGMTGE